MRSLLLRTRTLYSVLTWQLKSVNLRGLLYAINLRKCRQLRRPSRRLIRAGRAISTHGTVSNGVMSVWYSKVKLLYGGPFSGLAIKLSRTRSTYAGHKAQSGRCSGLALDGVGVPALWLLRVTLTLLVSIASIPSNLLVSLSRVISLRMIAHLHTRLVFW